MTKLVIYFLRFFFIASSIEIKCKGALTPKTKTIKITHKIDFAFCICTMHLL